MNVLLDQDAFRAKSGMHENMLTKITPPKPLGHVPRLELCEMIDAAQGGIVWISAPAGTGKTMLASGYVAARQAPCLWYQLDSGDTEVPTFFYYLSLALKRSRPRLRGRLPLLTPEYTAQIELFTRRCFEKLFDLLTRGAVEHGIMVLEDFQSVSEAPVVDVLREGLSVTPGNVTALVLSRNAPPPSFAGLRAAGRMNVLGWPELRFSPGETKAFFDLLPRAKLFSEQTVLCLHQRTQGWPAGLRLLGEVLPEGADTESLNHLSCDVVFDFFLKELFENAPARTREFLLKTAFLPSMTIKTAHALTGLDGHGDLLGQMIAQNFFITRHPGPETTFQYHQLFRDFLQTHAQNIFPPEEIALLRRNAAAILRDMDQPEEAAKLYAAGNLWENLGDLIQELAPTLVSQGRHQTLADWLEPLPAGMLVRRPWLNYWKAQALLPWRTQEGKAALDMAVHDFTEQGDDWGALLACAEMIKVIFLELGDFSRMHPYVQQVDAALRDGRSYPNLESEARVVMSMVLGCVFHRPDHPRRDYWMQRAAELMSADIPVSEKINLGFHLMIFYIYLGDMPRAGRIHAKVESLAAHLRLPDLSHLQRLVLEAVHAHLVDPNASHCRRTVNQALNIAKRTGIHIFDVFLLTIAAYTAVNRGDGEDLARMKQRLEPLIPKANSFDVGNYHCLLCCERLGLGDGDGAVKQAHLALEAVPKPRSPFPTILALLGLAESHVEAGRWPAARSFWKIARRMTLQIPGYKGDVQFLMPVAYWALTIGRKKVGLRVLQNALARGRAFGWKNALFWRPRQLALLCTAALEAGLEVEYVRFLARRHGLWSRIPANLHQAPPPALRIVTFGPLTVTREGNELVSPRIGAKKPLALLKALIVLGVKGWVAEGTLKDLLWPDTEGDRASYSLKFTLYALRKLLGVSEAVVVRGGLVRLDPQICRVDAAIFEQISTMVENNAPGNIPELDEITLCEKAVAIYQDDFLAQDPAEWIIPTREYFRNRCLRILDRLAQLHEQAGRTGRAIAAYERALAIDPLREAFYIGQVQLYLRVGRKAEAAHLVKHCKHIFKASLGVLPSKDLLNLV